MRVAVVVTVANLALGVALMPVLGHVGIALATGLTAWLNLALLAHALRRRGFLQLDGRFL
ncbi:lipid II flippase MurJ, partial [Azospirillum brasilense]|uniref:lipid II flippase MurJ n=1 Tax=Azospirillum brasilense TaxID=192 RepID=UPI0031F3369F